MTNLYARLITAVSPIALMLVGGCQQAAAPVPPRTAYVPPPVMAAVPDAAPAPAPPRDMTVRVAPDILSSCGIDITPSGAPPLFAFDSSRVSSDARNILDQVAVCFTTGALSGRAIKLIGRADPRGTEAYNLSLGDRRASGVESYLESRGMLASNLLESSRGALDAVGTDETGWSQDRRVDVELAEERVTVGSNP